MLELGGKLQREIVLVGRPDSETAPLRLFSTIKQGVFSFAIAWRASNTMGKTARNGC